MRTEDGSANRIVFTFKEFELVGMPEELTKQEQYLLKEYDTASQLTYHIDDLRNKLTSFFLTFAGVAAAGLTLLLKDEMKSSLFDPYYLIAILLSVIGFIGLVVIAILARLRKVQLEHFRIINNIRKHFLQLDMKLWNVVELSDDTLPLPDRLSAMSNRLSGSYLWLFMIILVTSFMFAASSYLFLIKVYSLVALEAGYWLSLLVLIITLILEDWLYFSLASPPPMRTYTMPHNH